ncbi:MAG TPA: MlaD family protein [Burkholderiales bacterium]|nr:MlaD family protein [Burkholderiales bacterium]
MEADKRYFFEGLFIIVGVVAAAFLFVWLAGSGHRDDVLYRIHFAESVSGLALGDPVKYRGVDVGTVKAMVIDAEDPRLVQVDVKLRKEAPVKTDTKATLKLKGITGVVFIELNGGSAGAKSLVAATPEGQIPEIPSEKSSLTALLEQLPKVVEKFSAIEGQAKKVLTDVGDVTGKIKQDPSVLLRRPRQKSGTDDK